MDNFLDNSEIDQVMEKLEELDDQELAVTLLKEFNDSTKELGQLIMNLDKSLSNDEWKEKCDLAKKKVDAVVEKILSL